MSKWTAIKRFTRVKTDMDRFRACVHNKSEPPTEPQPCFLQERVWMRGGDFIWNFYSDKSPVQGDELID